MKATRQGELFAADTPAPLPPDHIRRGGRVIDLAKVRPRIHGFIAELRASETIPWSVPTIKLRQTIIPRMIGYLPEAERPELTEAFEAEMERLLPGGELPVWRG